ncbi:hypothetical protein RAZWK3B_12422 [Roseobacter sp. AzwK-3b]|uniref:hypothetical protein n=1 Tax=Roseobacter sp. AzwK-3b TaxID=351016 RepID=UPI0001569F88|nr:hypothetical protein [Roseobacter sp. AzwK-3b]EDM69455.1 hypothetical protein RAZWK3B_12422 [Roseobacter sp. AzwK-3b]
MELLIWFGAFMSCVGLAALVWCIVTVWKARRAGLPDEALRERVRKVVPVNAGALMLSIMGLMLIVLGIFLG